MSLAKKNRQNGIFIENNYNILNLLYFTKKNKKVIFYVLMRKKYFDQNVIKHRSQMDSYIQPNKRHEKKYKN